MNEFNVSLHGFTMYSNHRPQVQLVKRTGMVVVPFVMANTRLLFDEPINGSELHIKLIYDEIGFHCTPVDKNRTRRFEDPDFALTMLCDYSSIISIIMD